MLGKLFTRSASSASINGAYIDDLGRVRRNGVDSWAGVNVDAENTLAIPGLWRGITLIADGVGALPWASYRGEIKVDPQPAILERPNPPETLIETKSAMVAGLLVHGNYLAVLGPPNAQGYPDVLHPVDPDKVHVWRERDGDEAGRIKYKINGGEYDQSEILHIKGFSMPGDLLGYGLLQAQRQGIGAAVALMEYAARYFDGGVTPSVVLKSENDDLQQDEADQLKAMWLNHYGGRSRMPAVLNASTKFEVVSDNAQESQMVEQRQYSLTDQANMLGTPGYYIGAPNSNRTYSNVEQENQQLIRWTLTRWLVRIEQSMSDLVPRGQTVKFNLDGLLRSDTLARYQAHQIALTNGFLTVDEVRALENRAPLGEA